MLATFKLALVALLLLPTTKPSPPTSQPQERTVYVTKTGKKYHKSSCGLAKKSQAITLSDAKARGLEPCSKCGG